MKKATLVYFIIFLSFWHSIYAQEEHELVYAKIKNILAPTLDDYKSIQEYLTNGERPKLKYLNKYRYNYKYDYMSLVRNFKIIGDTPDQIPESGDISVNCLSNDRENCLIVYSSFNKNYPAGVKRLVKYVASSDFKGHILYRIGGWPNVKGGSLFLAHVPYAFKVCFFKEAERRGYKRALGIHKLEDIKGMAFTREEINADTIFFVDKAFVHSSP